MNSIMQVVLFIAMAAFCGGCAVTAPSVPLFETAVLARPQRPVECEQAMSRIPPPRGDHNAVQALDKSEAQRAKGNAAIEIHNRCAAFDKKERPHGR